MSAVQRRKKPIEIPFWMSWFYGVLSVSLIPWTLYLQYTLPAQQASIPWRAMWVGFDMVLLVVSLAATCLLYKKSSWAGFVLTILAVLLAADTWFDAMTSAIASDQPMTLMTDIFIELPLALFSLGCAVYVLRQEKRTY